MMRARALPIVFALGVGCATEVLPQDPPLPPPPAVEYLSASDHLVRASMTLRGRRPSVADLQRVVTDPDALPAIVDGYLEMPEFGAVMRDLHAETLLVRVDLRNKTFNSIGPVANRTAGELNANVYEEPLRLIEHVIVNDKPFASAFSPARADEAALRMYTLNRADRERAVRGATGYNKRRVDDFVASLSRGDRLRALRGGLGTRGTQLDLNGQRSLALDAIATGVSQSVMMSSGVQWDTHDINAEQSDSHNYLFTNLTALVDELVARQMIDNTVIAVVSEMGRTPRLNGTNGKDHWPVTSAMVIGGGVAGAKAYGGTSSTGEAKLVNLSTGAFSSTGRTIEPKHFSAGLLSLCGVDPVDHLPEAEAFDAFVA